MKELTKQVDDIFGLVSLLRVSGDSVDLVAAVREKLRRLHQDVEKLPDTQPPSVPTSAVAEPAAEETRKLNPGPGPVGAPGPVDHVGQTGHEGTANQTASTGQHHITIFDSSKEVATDGGQNNG